MKAPDGNPFYRNPEHPHFNRRALRHDYNRPARYLITILKNPEIPPFSCIHADSLTDTTISINLSVTGRNIPQSISLWEKKYPSCRIAEYIIMPDHLHLGIEVHSYLPNGLSRAIANLKGMISVGYHESLASENKLEKLIPLFVKGYNDRIAYDAEQWQSQLHYIKDNPRRYLLKRTFPDYLQRRWLLTIDSNRSILLGNIFLLRQPFLLPVKFSRKYSPEEATATIRQWQTNLRNGGIPISPFIHPREKELRNYAAENGYSYIRVCTNGFSERQSPSGKEFEMMAQGRLLLIGREKFNSRKVDLIYSYAQSLNQLAARIASDCNHTKSATIRPLPHSSS
ncbi:MAG: hypothetical protein K2J15_06795 [Muribaculaceae bacterium]|nr:hypothetical protein [Muribaculaceae bacterium]